MPEKLVIPIPKGLKYIEGIGDAYREKLRQAGIRNVDELLDRGCSRTGPQRDRSSDRHQRKTITALDQ